MEPSGVVESIGVLLKEETLQTVENFVLENTLVLESIEPYPGYHGENLPTEARPDSLFLITDKLYPVDTIFRISQHLCCYQNIPVDAVPVEIYIHNVTYSGIRIRGLKNYSLIAEIQSCYMNKNIQFTKKKSIKSLALMRITKVFSLEKLAPHIYKDLEDSNTFYLSIPYHFKWEKFRAVTFSVQNNLDNSNFDCASGFIYLKDMIEFIRIYTQNHDLTKLQLIREKYLDEISKIRDDAL